MKHIKLSLLFENVLNNSPIDLNNYPDLKKFVDYFKGFMIQGKHIIKVSDFDSLLNKKNPATIEVLTYFSRGQFTLNYENTSPQGRVYNFAKGLYAKHSIPEYQNGFNDLIDLIADMGKMAGVSGNNNANKNSNNLKVTPLTQTLYLKNNNDVEVEGNNYVITDNMISNFINNPNDVIIKKYWTAMYNDDLSLPDDNTSEAGLIYTLFKKLKVSCKNILHADAQLDDRLGQLKTNGVAKTQRNQQSSAVNSIVFSTLPNGSQVGIKYKLFLSNGALYNNQNVTYSNIFNYFDLRGNEKFVNRSDKNNEFIFQHRHVPNSLEVGNKYHVEYNSISITKMDLQMEIIGLEINQTSNSKKSTAFDECGSMDELIILLGIGE